MVPEELRYTRDHEWVKTEDGSAVFGITHHAQELLGDIVFVELPQLGAEVKQSQSFGVVESVKAVSDLYAPISGTITELNSQLEDHPELVNQDPYGKGWMLKVSVTAADELANLMDAAAYKALVEES